ncbi:MAG: PQQ-like beta-propeller repeat protein [Acidobacteria bacterium]|nr:PQQ-like beta-propeller repeat protein [Acidobacteriota bacterium]
MPASQAVRTLLVLIAVAVTAVDVVFAQTSPSRLKWVYATGATINKSSPAIGADGTIYVGNGGHYLSPTPDLGLHAVTPDGKLKWKYTIGNYVYSPVLAADGTIYVQDATSTLHALDPDGMLRWEYRFDTPIGDNAMERCGGGI